MSREARTEDPVEELIRQARDGDQGALDELFRRCRPVLDEWASRRLARSRPGVARASDIAQDAALRAFQKFATFHGQTEAEWMTWLGSVLRSCTVQAFRDVSRMKRDDRGVMPLDSSEAMESPALQPSPSEETSLKEQWRETLAHVFHLPSEHREAITGYYLKELTVAEVAQAMGKTPAAVAGLLQRGLRALRSHVANSVAAEPQESSADSSASEAAVAFLAYLRRHDAGEQVEREAFIAEHPACEDELRGMLDWSERLHALRRTTSVQ